MTNHPIGQFLLKSLFRRILGEETLQFYETIDWIQASEQFRQPNLISPSYYSSKNFHGIEGGYLNPIAAITYDTVTAFASPPNETWIRQQLVTAISGEPSRILDLGCGTGSTTLMLKQAFPQAIVMGLDLSPYMLVVANHKARQAALEIQWWHGLAENTDLDNATFDLITISMLFHETPPPISRLILQECMRLLRIGGQLIILDGNQKRLRHAHGLIDLFREPYSKAYAAENVDDWVKAVGFETVRTKPIGWIHQVTRAVKPIASSPLQCLHEGTFVE